MQDDLAGEGFIVQPPLAEEVPSELHGLRRWVIWKPERRNGKITKRPIDAKVNDPKTWRSFDEARAAAIATGGGIGLVLGDGLVGVDFDHVIDCGEDFAEIIHPAVIDAIEKLASYAERSPSGAGVHVLIRGDLARSRKLMATARLPAREIYGQGRYFTVTGERLAATPLSLASGPAAQAALDQVVAELFGERDIPIVRPDGPHRGRVGELDDAEILTLLAKAKNHAKALRLLRGDTKGYPSPSEAEMALARILAFYSRDARQIDRIFRGSGLMRPKWDEIHGAGTHGENTIAKVLSAGGHRYREPAPVSATEVIAERERKAWGKFHLWWLRPLHGLRGPAPLQVLAVLCTYADGETGVAFPKVRTIQLHTGLSKRSVLAALNTLEAAGIMAKTKRPGTSPLYVLTSREVHAASPLLSRKERAKPAAPEVKRGADSCTLLGQERTHSEHALGLVTDHKRPLLNTQERNGQNVTPNSVTSMLRKDDKRTAKR